MLSTRTQLRLVALFYAVLGVLDFARIAMFTYMASSSQPASFEHELAQRVAASFPIVAAFAIFQFLLSVLVFRFLKLAASWRMAVVAGSICLGLLHTVGAVRGTLSEVALYENLGVRPYGPMTVQFAFYWGPTLALSLCAYVLWKSLRDARAKGQGAHE